jgi:ribosome-associated translation inhibitor RaiA
MRIDVSVHGFKADDGLRNYVGLRLMSVLDHLVRHVNGVVVSVTDVPAGRGEIRKRCRMQARLAPAGTSRVEATAFDMYGAIDRAAEELAGAVAFELARSVTAAPSLGTLRRAVEAVPRSEAPGSDKAAPREGPVVP